MQTQINNTDNGKCNRDSFLLLGFLVFILRKYNRGIGTRTIDLCIDILENKDRNYGTDYQNIHKNIPGYSISTIHKVFSLFIRIKIITKKDDGYMFDLENTNLLLNSFTKE